MSDVALLIAESIWFSPKENKGQVSFKEYGQAIENLMRFGAHNESFNVYNAGFYDKKSLKKCLDHLTDTNEERQILYVGAHGDGKKVSDANIKDVGAVITEKAGKIKGLIVSSCFAGQTEKLAQHSNWTFDDKYNFVNGPNWVVAYRHAVDWHLSALLELHLLHSICFQYCQDPTVLNSGAGIVEKFRETLDIFNPEMVIGSGGETLSETFRLWIRPQGSSELKEATDELFQY